MSHVCRRTGQETRRRIIAPAVLSVTALTLTGCAAEGSSSGGGGTSGGSASAVGVTKAKKAIAELEKPVSSWPPIPPLENDVSLKGKNVTIIPLGESIPVMHGMAIGAKKALKKMGATVNVCDGKVDPTQVASCLKQAQARGSFAVISLFVAYQMDGTAFNAAAKSGMNVLVAGDSPEKDKSYPSNLAFFDFGKSLQTLSRHEAEAAVAEKGADANVIWLGQTDNANTIAQAKAGVDHFKKICPDCGIVLAKYSTANSDKLPSQVSALLVSHPNTNIVVIPSDSTAAHALQGIKSSGYANKVTLISTGGDLSGLQRIAKNGGQSHDFAAPVIYNGFAIVNGMMQLAAGQKVKPLTNVTRDITVNNVNKLKLTQSEYFTSNWFGNDDFEQAFYKAWGVK